MVVHYDHGLTFEKCMEALKLGFTSIMYDCSTDSYEENVRKVRELVRIAHCFGATVEAELGHVGDNEEQTAHNGADVPESYYTDPAQAKEFAEKHRQMPWLSLWEPLTVLINSNRNWILTG